IVMNDYINGDLLEIAKQNSKAYQNADPFPNIYFENFFDPQNLEGVLEEFPDLSAIKAIEYKNEKERKLAGMGDRSFGEETKKIMYFLNSEPFLEFLQILTGIK